MTISDNTLQEFQKQFRQRLHSIYEERELTNIWFLILESSFGISRNFVISNPEYKISESEILRLMAILKRLEKHEPIQYILGKAHFADMELIVNPSVLIPRPETEELVHWIVTSIRQEVHTSILDIGTGSGCIPLAIKKSMPSTEVSGLDISGEAIKTAKTNATEQQLEVNFFKVDITDRKNWELYSSLDVIVSNPPYVLKNEAADMENRVKNFEPHVALFVNNEDPLYFFSVIAEFALEKLNKNGMLFFEINEAKGDDIVSLLNTYSFSEIVLKNDLNGKPRMIRAIL